MKKFLTVSLLVALAGFGFGCASNVKQIGAVGGVQFYRVRANSFSGPNVISIVTVGEDPAVKIQNTYAGPGLGAATISAVGHVGAAAVLGVSFPKNVGDNVSASGGVVTATGNGGNGGHGGSATATGTGTGGNATGGTGNGGAGGSATGGTKTHPDSPGNGGTPGDGGQNPNKP